MNMQWIDWAIVMAVFGFMTAALFYCNQYLHSVADFLSANRCAGRYLLTTAAQISGMGAISLVAMFQMYYQAGFSPLWWREMEAPMYLLMAMSGWVIYRYRETRAMTLAQFFEIRYSRGFRIFAGFICFLSGILNYGIFPAVSARAVMWIIGLPEQTMLLGAQVPTFAILMVIFLGAALAFCFLGGQITIMVTDFLQGVFCNLCIMAFCVFLLLYFTWDQISAAVLTAAENASMINPFKTGATEDFTPFYFISMIAMSFYGAMSWQGSQGYNSAARTPHEAKMAGILGSLRNQAGYLMYFMVPICAYTVMKHPAFADIAASVQNSLQAIQGNDAAHTVELHKQALVVFVFVKILPAGMVGLFCAMVMALMLTTDDTYLHSWGSIFIQDVIMPFRKKALSPRAHIWVLRAAIFGVAVFGFCFSLLFNQSQRILMFFQMTGAIWAGAGACIVGGLYWKRGTAGGAWTAIFTGAILGVGGTWLMQAKSWQRTLDWLGLVMPDLAHSLQAKYATFPIDGNRVAFYSCILALVGYVIVSLVQGALQRLEPFNLDRMLHRGKYRIAGEHVEGLADGEVTTGWRSLLADKEYTFGDKLIYYATMGIALFWFGFFLVITGLHISGLEFSDTWWLGYWKFRIVYGFIFIAIVTIWFSIGGILELPRLFRLLKEKKVDHLDDGRVIDHRNADDVEPQRAD